MSAVNQMKQHVFRVLIEIQAACLPIWTGSSLWRCLITYPRVPPPPIRIFFRPALSLLKKRKPSKATHIRLPSLAHTFTFSLSTFFFLFSQAEAFLRHTGRSSTFGGKILLNSADLHAQTPAVHSQWSPLLSRLSTAMCKCSSLIAVLQWC